MKDKSPEHLIHLHSKTSEEFYVRGQQYNCRNKDALTHWHSQNLCHGDDQLQTYTVHPST